MRNEESAGEGRKAGAARSILLVEDSQDDVELTREAFKEARIANRVEAVSNGVEALAFLRKKGVYSAVETPAVVLLDLHMPKKSGFEVLRELKDDPALSTVPVIVLTDSHLDIEVLRNYNCNPSAFVRKPVSVDDFLEAIRPLGIAGLPSYR